MLVLLPYCRCLILSISLIAVDVLLAEQWNQSCFQNLQKYKNASQFFSKINTVYQISHLPKVLVLASAGQTDEEEFQNFILNCDPYYKRHLQKLPESKHKSSAPEIEEELKTAFELYSNVCESFFNYFFFFLLIIGIQLHACLH